MNPTNPMNTGVTEYLLAAPNWDTLGPTFVEAIGDTLWMVAITMVEKRGGADCREPWREGTSMVWRGRTVFG